MEKIAYVILGIVLVGYILALIIGMIAAFPYGLIGLFILSGFALLFIKAIKDRLENKEDDYYSKNVDK